MSLPDPALAPIAGFADIVTDLKAVMPGLRGSLRANQLLSEITWFRVGGPAQAFFSPADEADLSYFLAHLPDEVPVTVIGLGSNLLVRDGGIPGVVIRLGRGFGDVVREGALGLRAGCAVPDVKLARAAAEAGIAGLAFYRGIPGSVGGALRMNGGAHGTETKDVLVSARAVDRQGRIHTLSLEDLAYTYRHCGAPEDWIFTSALYQGTPGDPAEILKEMDAVAEYRAANQPINKPTGGSTFKNPPGHSAWKLVDGAGLRGFMIGPAQVSDMHCNFLINTGGATGHHLELLGETVRGKVRAHSGITLEWEIKRLGVPAPGQDLVPEFAGIPA